MKVLSFIGLVLMVLSCKEQHQKSMHQILQNAPSIVGKTEYLKSPYVTAGNRAYMVGHQDGGFPDLGWHIKGEMGGIWNHPIKLMDGFDTYIDIGGERLSLDKASEFINYPMANKHVFMFPEKELEVARWQFVPDGKQGVFVQFVIKNTSEKEKNINFEFVGHSDLRPTWLGERTNMINSEDISSFEDGKWVVKDSKNEWYAVFGSDGNPIRQEQKESKEENASSNSLTYAMDIDQTAVINFVISGSYQSKEEALSEYSDIQDNYASYAMDKKLRYASLAQQSKLTIPDKNLQQTFQWLKYNCDWLVRSVPEIGTGIGAGIPDYPWWFGVDSEYALRGYMAIGQDDIVRKTIELLDSVSMSLNGNGKIIHEMSTNGAVFNEGNINETPQFASLMWEIYKWNGDKGFLNKYFSTVEKGLDWLLAENDANKNLFPDGFGMMEIHGLDSEMIDVAAYTQRAFKDASLMATELGKDNLAKKYAAIASQLHEKINSEFWSEEFNSYADFLGTDEQALHLIDDAIVRADTLNKPWAIDELKATKKKIENNPSTELKPFVLHHNWVVNTPMEMGIADSAKAITALNTAKKFTNPFGVFVTGIDRDESAGSNDGAYEAPPIFTYTGAVMTLPTGVQAIAENNYGRPNEALDYLQRMTRSFSYALPGSMYEVSPDFGMMTQAWNIYSFAVPIVQQFFGIQPMAHKKKVVIRPQMPSIWGEASIENVKIVDNDVSVFYHSDGDNLEVEILQTNPDWTIQLELPKGKYSSFGNVKTSELSNKSIFVTTDKTLKITSKQL